MYRSVIPVPGFASAIENYIIANYVIAMKSFHDLMVERRSIRKYTSEPIDAQHVKLIMEAALMAPSSKSSRPWSFIMVEDPEMLQRLSECRTMGSSPIAKCSLAIVVAADSSVSDPWVEDASIAAFAMQLQAADLGLGSCWIQVRNRYGVDNIPAEEYIQSLLHIPETINVECIIAIGHKGEDKRPQAVDRLQWEKVMIGEWRADEQA